MSFRALTSPAAGAAATVLLLVLLVLAGATISSPSSESDRPRATAAPAKPEAVAAPSRMSQVPASLGKRKSLGVLTNGCRYSERGIPQCGVLLGAAYGSNTDPADWERSMGHGLGVHRTYYDWNEVREAVATARLDLRAGRVPWISFKPPFYWYEMAEGRGDVWARHLAAQLATLNGPVWVAFHHEPEGDGDVENWTAMQERLAPIVRAEAPNVAYSVILTGWNQFYGSEEYSLKSLWPDTKIDLVGFDVYNKYGVEEAGRTSIERTRFKHHYFAKIQKFAEQHDVAWGLAETGYTDRSALVEPKFVQHLYNSVRRHGGVAVSYFNTTVNSVAPWRLTGVKEEQFAAQLRSTPTL